MKKLDLSGPVKRKRAVMLHAIGGWTSNSFLIVQGLVMVPLYLHFLGERQYGFWLASGGLLGWLFIVDFGVVAITQQRCAAAYGRKDLSAVASYFWHGLVITAVLLVFLGGVLVVFGLAINRWLDVDAEFRHVIQSCFYLAGAGCLMGFANGFLCAFAAALQRNHIPVFCQAAGDLLSLSVIFCSLYFFHLGLYSLALGAVVKSAVPFLCNSAHSVLIIFSIGFNGRWSKSVVMDYLKTSPSLLASKAMGVFSNNLPPILIARFLGPEATVAYSVTLRVLWILQNSINQGLAGLYAAFSHLFGDAEVSVQRRTDLARKAASTFVVAAGMSLPLYVMFNRGFVSLWTSEAQFGGQSFTVFVAIASFLSVRSSLLAGLGNSIGKIREVQALQAVESLVFAVLCLPGVFALGLLGVPLAKIVATLSLQLPVRKLLDSSGSVLRDALKSLYWVWVPVCALLLSVSWFSRFFMVDQWLKFVLLCAATAAPFGIGLLMGLPDLRAFLTRAAKRFSIRPFGFSGIR